MISKKAKAMLHVFGFMALVVVLFVGFSFVKNTSASSDLSSRVNSLVYNSFGPHATLQIVLDTLIEDPVERGLMENDLESAGYNLEQEYTVWGIVSITATMAVNDDQYEADWAAVYEEVLWAIENYEEPNPATNGNDCTGTDSYSGIGYESVANCWETCTDMNTCQNCCSGLSDDDSTSTCNKACSKRHMDN